MKVDGTESIKYSRKLTLLNNSIFVENNFNGTTRYKLLKKWNNNMKIFLLLYEKDY